MKIFSTCLQRAPVLRNPYQLQPKLQLKSFKLRFLIPRQNPVVIWRPLSRVQTALSPLRCMRTRTQRRIYQEEHNYYD